MVFSLFYLVFHSLALSAEFLCCWGVGKRKLVFCVICVTSINLKLWECHCTLVKFLTMHFCSHLIMGSVHWILKSSRVKSFFCCQCCLPFKGKSNSLVIAQWKYQIQKSYSWNISVYLNDCDYINTFLYAVIFQVPRKFWEDLCIKEVTFSV